MITKPNPETLTEQLALIMQLPERAAILTQNEKNELLLYISEIRENLKSKVLGIANHNPEHELNNLFDSISIRGFDLHKLDYLEGVLNYEPQPEKHEPEKHEKLDLADRLLILSYLQDNGNFPKQSPHIKKKDWTEFLSILLSENFNNFKKAEPSAASMKSKKTNLTSDQAKNYRPRLLNIIEIFEKAEIKGIVPEINKRIKFLESIING